MTTTFIRQGDVINVTATAGCTKGQVWAGTHRGGVYLATFSASTSNTAVPVALEGVFTLNKSAKGGADFAVGEAAYAISTGGEYKVIAAAATGSPSTTIHVGIAVEAATTGATTAKIKLGR